MATLQLNVRYRPLKIGFLVPWGDTDALVKVAGINSLLWGGIRNPVFPVGTDDAFREQLMRLFNVDVLFPVGDTPETKAIIERHPFLATPGHIAEGIFYEDWHTKKQNVAVLDVLHLIDYYWREEFRHKPPTFRSPFSLADWVGKDACANCLAVSLGHFPTDQNLVHDYRVAFEKGLRAQIIRIEPTDKIPPALAEAVSVLGLTEQRLNEVGGSRYDAGVYVGAASDFEDLLTFWNLRAAGIALEYLPLDSADRFKDYSQAWLSRLDAFPSRFPGQTGHIGIYSKEATGEKARELSQQFTIRKHFSHLTSSPHLWNGLNIVPVRTYFSRDTALADVDRQYRKYTVSFSLPAKPISDDDSRADTGSQHLVALVDPLVEFAYPDHTLKPPFLRTLNEFLSRQITFDPWKLRVDPDGLALIQRAYESSETLYPVPTRALLVKLFDLAGIKAATSTPGLIADKIIHSMRETDPLEACRVFKIRGVRRLLKELRVGQAVTWEEAVSTIGRAEFQKFKDLYIDAREGGDLRPQDVVEYLLKKRILCPQLRLLARLLRKRHTFSCPSCGLKSDILYREFEGSWTCPFCTETQDLRPLVAKEFRHDRSAWVFKRCGFFAKDNNQEGALPVLLALLQLKRVLDSSTFAYSTALVLDLAGHRCETDLVVLQHGRRDSIELGIGECKDEGGTITGDDVQKLKVIARRFKEEHRVKTFLVFAKAAETFQPEELKLFKQLAKDGQGPVLMTNQELEVYQPYEHVRGTVPVAYPFTLEEMARNSAAIYLAGPD
jgi:hypothetical protein